MYSWSQVRTLTKFWLIECKQKYLVPLGERKCLLILLAGMCLGGWPLGLLT